MLMAWALLLRYSDVGVRLALQRGGQTQALSRPGWRLRVGHYFVKCHPCDARYFGGIERVWLTRFIVAKEDDIYDWKAIIGDERFALYVAHRPSDGHADLFSNLTAQRLFKDIVGYASAFNFAADKRECACRVRFLSAPQDNQPTIIMKDGGFDIDHICFVTHATPIWKR